MIYGSWLRTAEQIGINVKTLFLLWLAHIIITITSDLFPQISNFPNVFAKLSLQLPLAE